MRFVFRCCAVHCGETTGITLQIIKANNTETTICYERGGQSDHLHLFLRFYSTPARHSMVRLQRTWLSSSVLVFLGELLGRLTNSYWSSQRTSSNWLAWGLSQCASLASGTRFHWRLKAAHLCLSLKLSLRPIFFDKHIFRLPIFFSFLFFFFWFLGLLGPVQTSCFCRAELNCNLVRL